MSFKIKNLRPTFVTIALASKTVTIAALGADGPFEDLEYSEGLTLAESRGDVATFDRKETICEAINEPREAVAGDTLVETTPKPRKSTVVEDKL